MNTQVRRFLRRASGGLVCVLWAQALGLAVSPVQAADCSAAKIGELLSPASAEQSSVKIDCTVRLRGAHHITKSILISGSGSSRILVDLAGSTVAPVDRPRPLEIASERLTNPDTGEVTWSRPQSVTIRNAVLVGKTRIFGMGLYQASPDLFASSTSLGHTQRAQANAPRLITFVNVTFRGTGGTPLYVSPGVTYVRILQSRVEGESTEAAVYFAAESAYHLVKDTHIEVTTDSREQIAVDGTARSMFVNNRFFSLANGGVYLYRNCGEGGAVRHQTPRFNQFINNVFFYGGAPGENPAIWLASRNGNRSYCAADSGYPFGSSIDDSDFARNNVVLENQFIGHDPGLAIRRDDAPNVIRDNQKVAAMISRHASCYQANLYPDPLLVHGEHSDYVFQPRTRNPICSGKRSTCNDGIITQTRITCPPS